MNKKMMLSAILTFSSLSMPSCGFEELWSDIPSPDFPICTLETSQEQEYLASDDVPTVEESDRKLWASQVNRLGSQFLSLEMYQDESFVFSPAALHSSLAMAAHGANASTYDEIADVLGYKYKREVDIKRSADMLLNLRFDGQNDNSHLVMGNNIWFSHDTLIHDDFKFSIDSIFKTSIWMCQFLNYTIEALQFITDWIWDLTKYYIDVYDLEHSIKFMLVNATEFTAQWAYPFDKSKTKAQTFFGTLKDVSIDFMHLIYDFEYYNNPEEGYQAIIMPYMDGVFDMVIILPDSRDSAQKVIQGITADDFGTILVEAEKTKLIELSLPKFEVSFDKSSDELIESLRNMGIKEAFVEGFAKFDIISPTASVFVDSFIHQAVIAIDESGANVVQDVTATSDIIETEDNMIPFEVNHAFAFAIVHRSSGAIVYLGFINDLN